MKLASIFMMSTGVTADFAAADSAISEVIGAANDMLNAPVFTDALDQTLRQKWADRIDRVVKRKLVQRFEACGDLNAPDMPAFTAPSYDNICEHPKVVFDRIAAWTRNYMSNCRTPVADNFDRKMNNWTKWMFRRTGCGYKWMNAEDRWNNGHFLGQGEYTIDNRCNPNWVSKNGADCDEISQYCYTDRWTTQYVFSEFGLHLLPMTGLETEFGIQTAYSCPQCGCTGDINTDSARKPGDALYPAPQNG